MKLKLLTIAITSIIFNSASVFASTSLQGYINQSIENNYHIKSLDADYNVEKVKLEQENKYYLPKFTLEHTTKTNAAEGKKAGINFFDNRSSESTATLRSNIWHDNHHFQTDMLSSKANAAQMDVEIQKSNIRAQITTKIFNIFLYEKLIKEGKSILDTAKKIDHDIHNKVKGGLAKASDETTAEVLINDMSNEILAIKLKIKQLKLNLEQEAGIPYPRDIFVDPENVHNLIYKKINNGIENNRKLLKKVYETTAARKEIDAAQNWVKVDLYAKTKAEDFTFSRPDTEVGVTVSVDLFNPANYWKDKRSTYKYQSEKYMLDQMRDDLGLNLKSQLSILESNRKLLASQIESLKVKRDLIRERQDEYQINVTSLYELIQAWNGYYSAIQMKTDTEATLINTMMSIQVLTGDC